MIVVYAIANPKFFGGNNTIFYYGVDIRRQSRDDKYTMNKTLIGIVIAVLVVGAAVFYFQSKPAHAPTETIMPQADTTTKQNNGTTERKSISISLKEQNASKETGSTILTDLGDGKTKVEISLTGATATISQPAHIHAGSCATIGGVKYPLTDVVNGASEKILDVSMDSLLSQLPLAVNVHKSQSEAKVYVSCGDISRDGMMGMSGSMMDSGTMMENSVTIEITSGGFSPQTVTVKAGTKVTWVNKTTSTSWPATAIHPTHAVYPGSDINKCGTSEASAIFDACHEMKPGELYSFIFNEKGTWAYHDHKYPSRFGKIVVE